DNSVYLDAAQKLHQKNNCSVCMTLGDSGCLYVNKSGTVYIPTKKVTSPIDICGAGDTFISAFACALATGVKGYEAAFFANIAASIIVKKIGMTGTATQKEIIQKYNQIYNINEE
ncbi:MAG: hypothetical protein KAQ68_06145, partial [Clostridiales bacterium]|nr:hypothetical protein [Clostridiales bacterium]